MKKMIGMVALCVFGLVVASALAQVPAAAPVAAPEAAVAAPVAPVAAPVAAVEAAAASVEAAAASVAASATAAVEAAPQSLTVKGKVSVVNGPDGMLQAIYINPAEVGSHGYKVDIVNGEGKTLADKNGQTVEAVGVDANRLFTIATVTVVQ
jgi:hypothetical protein